MGKKNHQCATIDEPKNITIGFHDNIELDARKAEIEAEITKKFIPKKLKSEMLSSVYHDLDMSGRASRVLECGSFLEYHVTAEKGKLARANFCKDRLCPMCNWRRSLKIFSQVSQVMDVLENKGLKFIFLTLTIKNCSSEDFPKSCQILMDGWRQLYHEEKRFQAIAEGTFRSLEVTRNRNTGEWHPHLHVIIAVKPEYFTDSRLYMSQSEFVNLWQKVCDLEYKPVVDIRIVRDTKEKDIKGVVSEVAKYSVKSNDFLNGDNGQVRDNVSTLLFALTRRRLCDFTGIFKEVRKELMLDDVEDGNLISVTGELRTDITALIVRYRWKSGVYMAI